MMIISKSMNENYAKYAPLLTVAYCCRILGLIFVSLIVIILTRHCCSQFLDTLCINDCCYIKMLFTISGHPTKPARRAKQYCC